DPGPVSGDGAGSLFVGNFDTLPGLDLVAVDPDANSLTYTSNFTAAGATSVTMSTGGVLPVAGLTGDFNGDGLDDLILAHNGDGTLSVILGGAGGPALSQTLSATGVAHPTDLAFGTPPGLVSAAVPPPS